MSFFSSTGATLSCMPHGMRPWVHSCFVEWTTTHDGPMKERNEVAFKHFDFKRLAHAAVAVVAATACSRLVA